MGGGNITTMSERSLPRVLGAVVLVVLGFMGCIALWGGSNLSDSAGNEAVDTSLSLSNNKPAASEKSGICKHFVAHTGGCTQADWTGVFRDWFSPDDTCPLSTRYIDLTDGKLHVSASNTDNGCDSTWGRRFDPTTTVDPIITLEGSGCTATVSFRSKIPTNSPMYSLAQNGALDFTLTLSRSERGSRPLIKWNGMYNGKGGPTPDGTAPADSCDNIWAPSTAPGDAPIAT